MCGGIRASVHTHVYVATEDNLNLSAVSLFFFPCSVFSTVSHSLELAKQARLAGSTCLHLPGTGIPTAPHQTQLLKGRVLCSFGTNTLLTELFPQPDSDFTFSDVRHRSTQLFLPWPSETPVCQDIRVSVGFLWQSYVPCKAFAKQRLPASLPPSLPLQMALGVIK